MTCIGRLNLPTGLRKIARMASTIQAESLGKRASDGSRRPSPEKETRSRERRQPPNIFTAIPVDSPDIHIKIREVQRRLIDAVPRAERCMESTRKQHVTLNLTATDDSGIEGISAQFSARIQEIVSSPTLSNFNGTHLKVEGIGQFNGHRVIFCKVSAVGFVLDELFKKLNELLEASGYPLLHKPELSAHLTLFKIKGRAKFTPNEWEKLREVYNEIDKEDVNFGVQPVKELQLLHMMLPKDQNGYYAMLASSTADHAIMSKETFDELHKNCCARPYRT